MVATGVIETGGEGMKLVINPGLYDHEPEVAVKGHEAIKTKLEMYSGSKRLLN